MFAGWVDIHGSLGVTFFLGTALVCTDLAGTAPEQLSGILAEVTSQRQHTRFHELRVFWGGTRTCFGFPG